VPHFATVAELFTELTKARNPDKVRWSDQCERAFCKLKELLLIPPVLKVTDPTKCYILQTDASEQGLGAVLSQMEDGGKNIQWHLPAGNSCPERRIIQ